MLDIKYVINNLDYVIERLNLRNGDYSYLKQLPDMYENLRKKIYEVEQYKKERNDKSKLIGQYKRENKDTTDLMNSINNFGDSIKKLDEEIKKIQDEINDLLLVTPNMPFKDVPIGKSDEENKVIFKYLEPTKFNFQPKEHYEIAEKLDILDFKRAVKVTGSRFVCYKGLGARLERALINFMMDLHADNGYKEVLPPLIVNTESMYGTGQYPKFIEDSYRLLGDEGWVLNPTAEVPTINMHKNELLDESELPIKYTSFTTAFRSEAGSAGKDLKGILRLHQFNKVELIKITTPETSYQELEDMLVESRKVLELLKIPYRVVDLCTGDLGFNATRTYDIEVWLPGQNKYREIASISNDEDFQARRANIKYKSKDGNKYVHTLNGSGLAVGRTVIAIIENYQNEDGSITIPEVLVPYMRVNKIA